MRYAIVGAGILGLSVARRLAETRADADIAVFEKEDRVGVHQTGHASGVVHAGLITRPARLKATLCRRGGAMLREFCLEHDLPYEECGKVVVARDTSEIAGLDALEARARRNGVPSLRRLDARGLFATEPAVRGVAALHSPRTAIVEFDAITRALATGLAAAGCALRLGSELTSITTVGREVRLYAGGEDDAFDRVILCAGLQSDRVARFAGDAQGPRSCRSAASTFGSYPKSPTACAGSSTRSRTRACRFSACISLDASTARSMSARTRYSHSRARVTTGERCHCWTSPRCCAGRGFGGSCDRTGAKGSRSCADRSLGERLCRTRERWCPSLLRATSFPRRRASARRPSTQTSSG